jgi:predicted RNase H-like HicB family nuclease
MITLTYELDREDDGRWIAEVLELPGVLAYGDSRDEAIKVAHALALRVLADQVAHGDRPPVEGYRFRDAADG